MRDPVALPAAERFATALREAFSFRRPLPLVSFVVRTYWGQMTSAPFTLKRTLRALRRLQDPRWEALVVQTDARLDVIDAQHDRWPQRRAGRRLKCFHRRQPCGNPTLQLSAR